MRNSESKAHICTKCALEPAIKFKSSTKAAIRMPGIHLERRQRKQERKSSASMTLVAVPWGIPLGCLVSGAHALPGNLQAPLDSLNGLNIDFATCSCNPMKEAAETATLAEIRLYNFAKSTLKHHNPGFPMVTCSAVNASLARAFRVPPPWRQLRLMKHLM